MIIYESFRVYGSILLSRPDGLVCKSTRHVRVYREFVIIADPYCRRRMEGKTYEYTKIETPLCWQRDPTPGLLSSFPRKCRSGIVNTWRNSVFYRSVRNRRILICVWLQNRSSSYPSYARVLCTSDVFRRRFRRMYYARVFVENSVYDTIGVMKVVVYGRILSEYKLVSELRPFKKNFFF